MSEERHERLGGEVKRKQQNEAKEVRPWQQQRQSNNFHFLTVQSARRSRDESLEYAHMLVDPEQHYRGSTDIRAQIPNRRCVQAHTDELTDKATN